MRKVYYEAVVEVPVMVKARVSFTVRADDDANLDRALKLWSRQKAYSKADLEDLQVQGIVKVGVQEGDDDLCVAVQDALTNGPYKLHGYEVLDSK